MASQPSSSLLLCLQITHFMHHCPCYLCELYSQALLVFLSQECNYLGFSLALLIKALFFTSFGLLAVSYFDMLDAFFGVNCLPEKSWLIFAMVSNQSPIPSCHNPLYPRKKKCRQVSTDTLSMLLPSYWATYSYFTFILTACSMWVQLFHFSTK